LGQQENSVNLAIIITPPKDALMQKYSSNRILFVLLNLKPLDFKAGDFLPSPAWDHKYQ
jgi:hypothetical protein